MLQMLLRTARRCYGTIGRVNVRWLQHVNLSKEDSLNDIVLIGWLRSIRRHKDIVFMTLDDGSSVKPLQIVIPAASVSPELNVGACIRAKGDLHSSFGRQQSVELRGKEISVFAGKSSSEQPLSDGRHIKNETARQWPHLRPRLSPYSAVWRLRHGLERAFRQIYDTNGYVHVHTPLLTEGDCEGAGEALSIVNGGPFFGKEDASKIHLTVSSQLHLEAAASALGNVYTLSPAWRGEKSLTRHHLVEFYMLEAESVDLNSEDAICNHVEDLLKETAKTFMNVTNDIEAELAVIEKQFGADSTSSESKVEKIQSFCETPFVRMTFTEALDLLLLNADKFQEVPVNEVTTDFGKEHERFLCKCVGDKPVFITGFPLSSKPFYCAMTVDGFAQAVDLILPDIGEVMGGSVREVDAEILKQKMFLTGGEQFVSAMHWYLELREFGCPPHGGYGIGFDRLLQFFTGVPNIKDIVPFPRFYGSCRL